MGRLQGRVALVTGAGRAPGRGFAARLVREGAAVLAIDADDAAAPDGPADLAATVALVEALGGRVVARRADVRDAAALAAAVTSGVRRLGRLDAVVVGPSATAPGSVTGLADEVWRDTLDRVLTGVWNTVRAALPHLRDGGSITVAATAAGLRGFADLAHHAAAEHGVVGLMRSLAHELAPRSIRVNTVHPTDSVADESRGGADHLVFVPEVDAPPPFAGARDVSETVVYLASDDARFITGVTLPVDTGLVPS